jgi:hypothetical protein
MRNGKLNGSSHRIGSAGTHGLTFSAPHLQFVIFCTYHDGSTLVVDPEFTSKYERLVRKFAQFCQYENGDDGLKLK